MNIFPALPFLLVAALAVAPATLDAQQVVKCTLPDGSVTYSDSPCPTGSNAANPNLIDNATSAEALKEAVNAYPPRKRPANAGGSSGSGNALYSRFDCEDAMRNYEIAAGSVQKDPYEIVAKRDRARLICSRAR